MDVKFFKPRTGEVDYREVIASHAKVGWRFKQIFAPSTTGYGSSTYFELIFEKEV